MTNEFLKLLFLSIACGAISMTLSKAKIFAPLRSWLKAHFPWFGEAVSCPYCTSHWVAAGLTLIYFPRPISCGFAPVDFFVSAMALVALTSISARVIFSAYAVMSD